MKLKRNKMKGKYYTELHEVYLNNLKRNKMKQTAVEWLFKELLILDKKMSIEEILTQAKEMEEQQQDEFAVDFIEWLNEIKISDNQVYYNNTLGELLVNFKNK